MKTPFHRRSMEVARSRWAPVTDKCIREIKKVAGQILVQVGSATKVCHSQIFLHSKSFQVILTQIPIQALANLSTRVFKTRTATGIGHFACQDSVVHQIFILIISNGENILSNIKVVVWRQVKRGNG